MAEVTGAVPWKDLGFVLVGGLVFIKGALDAWARTRTKGQCHTCPFSDSAGKKLDDLWRAHCGPQATDPVDGLPRWYSRDLARETLRVVRRERGDTD